MNDGASGMNNSEVLENAFGTVPWYSSVNYSTVFNINETLINTITAYRLVRYILYTCKIWIGHYASCCRIVNCDFCNFIFSSPRFLRFRPADC